MALLSQMPDIFRSRGLAIGTDMSGFRMFEGNGAFQYGSTADFTNLSTVDAPQHTLMIFETMPQNAEYWTEPDEIPFNPANPLAGLTLAPDFFLAATANKEIKQINPSVAPQTFAAFATWDGHEVLSDAQYANLYVNWDATDNATISTQKLEAIYQASIGFQNQNYDFPPGSVVPASWIDPTTGMPYLSWRVYILPFLGYTRSLQPIPLERAVEQPEQHPAPGRHAARVPQPRPVARHDAFGFQTHRRAGRVQRDDLRIELQWPAINGLIDGEPDDDQRRGTHARPGRSLDPVERDPIFRGQSTRRLWDDPRPTDCGP